MKNVMTKNDAFLYASSFLKKYGRYNGGYTLLENEMKLQEFYDEDILLVKFWINKLTS